MEDKNTIICYYSGDNNLTTTSGINLIIGPSGNYCYYAEDNIIKELETDTVVLDLNN